MKVGNSIPKTYYYGNTFLLYFTPTLLSTFMSTLIEQSQIKNVNYKNGETRYRQLHNWLNKIFYKHSLKLETLVILSILSTDRLDNFQKYVLNLKK